MPQKIIIDTDPGVDDTMAIYFALRSPELDLIGLTTIFGNVDVDLATTNALRLLEIAGRPDIPVARGAQNPIAGSYKGAVPFIHGDDGQGNAHLPPPQTKALDTTAAEFIIAQVMGAPGQVTLVPIGPLTNIALALQIEPRIAEQARAVVLMGGNAFCPGNTTPAAEANIWGDPEAADKVFGASWGVTMVGLDVTLKVNMKAKHFARYAAASNPLAQHIARIMPCYQDFCENYYPGLDGIHVHDSTAIAYLVDPSLFTVKRWPVRVETQGFSRGKTWPGDIGLDEGEHDLLAPWAGRPLVNVCLDVDAECQLELEVGRLT